MRSDPQIELPFSNPKYPKKLALVAGEGCLPLYVAENAVSKGITVIPFCLTKGNQRALARITQQTPLSIQPGMMSQNLSLAKKYGIRDVVFAGKVNKWILLQNPRLDRLAIDCLKRLWPRNDDKVMESVIQLLAQHELHVWSQAQYLQKLLLGPQALSVLTANSEHWQDIRFGFQLAKTMGELDIGQTVVVRQGMVLAVEALEGTDRCLLRAGQLSQKNTGAVVVKVAKPTQDNRFDIPTVGLRTLKRMKQAGLTVLATEAHRTLYLEAEAMTNFANRHGLIIVSVDSLQIA